ncbi:hypothetical protein NE642_17000, partial [Erysipelatoclostridium ramosum]|nr:hypothetical protein [Thomasclavelia ramosa]
EVITIHTGDSYSYLATVIYTTSISYVLNTLVGCVIASNNELSMYKLIDYTELSQTLILFFFELVQCAIFFLFLIFYLETLFQKICICL